MAADDQPKPKTILWHDVDGTRRRRPAGAMPVEQHLIAGRILSTIIASPIVPQLVKTNLSFVQEDLTDWLDEEIDQQNIATISQHDGEFDFLDAYHIPPDKDGPYAEGARSASGCQELLEVIEAQLQAAYPKCHVLRKQLDTLKSAIRMIANNAPKQ